MTLEITSCKKKPLCYKVKGFTEFKEVAFRTMVIFIFPQVNLSTSKDIVFLMENILADTHHRAIGRRMRKWKVFHFGLSAMRGRLRHTFTLWYWIMTSVLMMMYT